MNVAIQIPSKETFGVSLDNEAVLTSLLPQFALWEILSNPLERR